VPRPPRLPGGATCCLLTAVTSRRGTQLPQTPGQVLSPGGSPDSAGAGGVTGSRTTGTGSCCSPRRLCRAAWGDATNTGQAPTKAPTKAFPPSEATTPSPKKCSGNSPSPARTCDHPEHPSGTGAAPAALPEAAVYAEQLGGRQGKAPAAPRPPPASPHTGTLCPPRACPAPSTNTASVIPCYPCSRNVSPAPAHPAPGQGFSVPRAMSSGHLSSMPELRLGWGPLPRPPRDGGPGLTPSHCVLGCGAGLGGTRAEPRCRAG